MIRLLAVSSRVGQVIHVGLRPNHPVANALLPAMVSGVACFTIVILLGPYFIRIIHKLGWGTTIKEELPEHQHKAGTPTMGGLLFVVPVLVLTVTYNLFHHLSVLLLVVVLTLSAALGYLDDRLSTVKIGGEGIRGRFKMTWLIVIAIAIVWILHIDKLLSVRDQNQVWVPTVGLVNLGWGYWPLAVVVIVATANAVNLTDGMDGLAAGTSAVAFAAFGAIALLSIPAKPYLGEFSFTMVGALLAFLWFNCYPAKIIMGDTGSLAVGATLATVALMLDQALILPIIGFVFVIETLTVIIQLSYYRLTSGKRIFLASPLHSHLQRLGWTETQVTQRFWIVSMLAAVAGLALAFI